LSNKAGAGTPPSGFGSLNKWGKAGEKKKPIKYGKCAGVDSIFEEEI
jgi:hypothetical protein